VQPAVALQWVYNLGRIGSYTLAGALAGTVGSAAWISSHLLPLQQAAFAIGSLMMILIGLHLTGLPVLAHWLERAGSRVWRLVEPAARWSLRRSGMAGALLAGAAWGWVPCGMVYSVLTAALVSGSAASGAAIMLAFGVGTLPGLTAFGWLARQGLARTRSPTLLRAAGGAHGAALAFPEVGPGLVLALLAGAVRDGDLVTVDRADDGLTVTSTGPAPRLDGGDDVVVAELLDD
jgi:sulfite exporter TauE/SafE